MKVIQIKVMETTMLIIMLRMRRPQSLETLEQLKALIETEKPDCLILVETKLDSAYKNAEFLAALQPYKSACPRW